MADLFVKIPPASARLGTLLASRAGKLSFRAGEAAWTFLPVASKGGVHGVAVYGKLGTAEYSLWLDEPEWRVAAATVLAVRTEDVAELPPSLVQAALECFFTDALTVIEKSLGLPFSVMRLEMREVPPLASAIPFRLMREDGMVLSGAWLAHEGEWREAVEKALLSVMPSHSPIPEDLRLKGNISAGTWLLAVRKLRNLETGDVVLSPLAALWSLTVGRRFRFAAFFEEGKLVVDGKKNIDATLAGNAASETEPANLANLDEAEVELRAEVGRLDITLGELRRLSIGEVVEFPTTLASPATLIAGGKAVAWGDLVDVGGRLGVRITALAHSQSVGNGVIFGSGEANAKDQPDTKTQT